MVKSISFLRVIKHLTLATLMLTTAWVHAANITIKDATGERVVPVQPKKVVVFDLAALDIMNALGVKAAAVPTVVHFPKYLSEYASNSVPKVGSLFEPDYEKVFGLNPDLIIVGGRSQPKFADLAKIAPTIDLTVDSKNLLGSVERNTHILATIFKKEDQAKALLTKLTTSIDALKAKAPSAGNAMVLLTTGGRISAFGPGSRFGAIHDTFGIPAADKNLQTSNHGQAVSFELIYKMNPDWIYVVDRDAAIGREGVSAKALLDNELMHKTKAWQNNHIIYLDGINWYLLSGAGLTSMQNDVDQIMQTLSKK